MVVPHQEAWRTPSENPERRICRAAEGAIHIWITSIKSATRTLAQFYWGRPEAWLEDAPIFDARSTAVEIPRWRVQDIDTEEDWIRAELLHQLLEQLPSRNE